jgi:predicted nuclease of predicted toxin-antitoxin system
VRIVLDHCVPRRLGTLLSGHEVTTVGALGFADLDDGPLLDQLAGICDALVTVDRRLPAQQRLAGRPFAVIVLRGRTNRLGDLALLAPTLLSVLRSAPIGQATLVGV